MDAVTNAFVAAGLPAGAVPFMLCLFAAPLLCAAHGRLRGTTLRHVASVLLGLSMCVFVFGAAGSAPLAPPVLATHALMALSPRRCAAPVSALTFGYLVWCHIAQASGDAWKEGNIDFTGSLMVVTLKLVSTAFDVADGAAPSASPTPHQAAARLPRRPTLLELLSYCLYPGTLLAGPSMPLAVYKAFIERTGVWSPSAPAPPSALLPTLAAALPATAFAVAHAALTPLVPDSAFLERRWVSSRSVTHKVAYMVLMAFAARCKYYFVWGWADAACRAGGLGWAGYAPPEGAPPAAPPGPRWDRARNVRPLHVELATSAAQYPLAWNTHTGTWLRHYCYERLMAPPLRAPPFAALLVTQLVSGVWHGVYAGYALFFASSTFMLHASKVLFRYQRALPPRARQLSNIGHGALSCFHLNYLAAAFIAITLPAGRAAWESVHYVGHISMLAITLLGWVLPPPKAKKKDKDGGAAAAPLGARRAAAAESDGATPAAGRDKRA